MLLIVVAGGIGILVLFNIFNKLFDKLVVYMTERSTRLTNEFFEKRKLLKEELKKKRQLEKWI